MERKMLAVFFFYSFVCQEVKRKQTEEQTIKSRLRGKGLYADQHVFLPNPFPLILFHSSLLSCNILFLSFFYLNLFLIIFFPLPQRHFPPFLLFLLPRFFLSLSFFLFLDSLHICVSLCRVMCCFSFFSQIYFILLNLR